MCVYVCVVTQSCPTLCDPMDWGPPGPMAWDSVHGILQARILEWVAISFSTGMCKSKSTLFLEAVLKCSCFTFYVCIY